MDCVCVQNINNGYLKITELIDLKAELFRKQEEFKAFKQKNSSSDYVKGKSSASTSSKKLSIWKKSNAGVAKRAEKDYEEKLEEEDAFERSKRELESKAKLYEQITQGTEFPDEDGGGQFLVDFQQKVIDEDAEKRKKVRRMVEERASITEEEAFRKQLYQPVLPAEEEKNGATATSRTLMSDDMRREEERERWEQEEETVQDQKPVHYTDVLHNEIRTHGVGYYKFDTDESVRQEQLSELGKLREKTKDERSKSDRIKDKRKAALAARLAKVKQRKREKAGLPAAGSDDDKSSGDEIGPQPVKEPEVVKPLTRDDSWRQTTESTREWDKDKEYMLQRSEKSWLEKQRSEREDEFAPPSFYYQDTNNRKSGIKKQQNISETNSMHSKLADRLIQEVSNQCDQGQSSNHTTADTGNNLGEEKQKHENGQPPSVYGSGQTSSVYTHQASQGSTHMHLSNVVRSVISGHIGDNSTVSSLDGIKLASHELDTPSPNVYAQPPDMNYPYYDTNAPPLNLNIPPPNTYLPTPNMNVPPPNINIPPPHMNPPLPDVNINLPCLNVPPPNVNIPPPDISVPIADMSIPPPNMIVPPPNLNAPPPNLNIPPSDINVTSSIMNPPAADVHALSTDTNVLVPKTKFVPKLSIVDTRLMASEDD